MEQCSPPGNPGDLGVVDQDRCGPAGLDLGRDPFVGRLQDELVGSERDRVDGEPAHLVLVDLDQVEARLEVAAALRREGLRIAQTDAGSGEGEVRVEVHDAGVRELHRDDVPVDAFGGKGRAEGLQPLDVGAVSDAEEHVVVGDQDVAAFDVAAVHLAHLRQPGQWKPTCSTVQIPSSPARSAACAAAIIGVMGPKPLSEMLDRMSVSYYRTHVQL